MVAPLHKPKGIILLGLLFLVLGMGTALVAVTNLASQTIVGAATQRCFDSDGGMNYYLYGYVTEAGNRYYDACLDSSNLREAICKDGHLDYSLFECRYGCNAGQCNDS